MKPFPNYTVEILYLGEGVNFFDKIVQHFREKSGNTISFRGIKGIHFGQSYLISKDGRIKSRNPPSPKTQTLKASEKDYLDYEVRKEIVKQTRLESKKAMDLKKPHADIVKAINILRPFVVNLDSIDLERFSRYIKNQLSRKRRK